jgi:hypothetical protein
VRTTRHWFYSFLQTLLHVKNILLCNWYSQLVFFDSKTNVLNCLSSACKWYALTHTTWNQCVTRLSLIQWVCISVVRLFEIIKNRHSSFFLNYVRIRKLLVLVLTKTRIKETTGHGYQKIPIKNQQFSWIGGCNSDFFSKFWEAWLCIRNDPLMIIARGLFLYLTTA